VHARGTILVRLLRGLRDLGRRADLQVHAGQALPGAGPAHRRGPALLHGRRRA
jgi:hypothetical protein